MEIVTGKAGVPHVSSADDGRRIAGEVGTGSYVLQTGGKLAPSLVDANTVRIATGDMIVQGRHIGVTAPEDVKVASGSQGKKRMDYICVHYTRDVSGSRPTLVETVEWKVLQGTPGSSAAAPSVPKGSILLGDADVTVPICSVTFDGLTTGQPKLLIPELTPLADLGDSVYREVGFQFLYGNSFSDDFVAFRKKGFTVEMVWNFVQTTTEVWIAGTLPAGFHPAKSFLEPSVLTGPGGITSNNTSEVEVADTGRVLFVCGAAVAGGRNIGHCIWIAA